MHGHSRAASRIRNDPNLVAGHGGFVWLRMTISRLGRFLADELLTVPGQLYHYTGTVVLSRPPLHGHQHRPDQRRADLSADCESGQISDRIGPAPPRGGTSPDSHACAAAESDAEHDREGVRRARNLGHRSEAARRGHVRVRGALAAGTSGAAPHHRAAHRRAARRSASAEFHRGRHRKNPARAPRRHESGLRREARARREIAMAQTIVEVSGLSRSFGSKKALDSVSFLATTGQVYGLVGSNGAGKTTLIKHLLGLLRAQRGTVRVFGLDPVRHPVEVLGRIGYLSEDRELPEWMRIDEL